MQSAEKTYQSNEKNTGNRSGRNEYKIDSTKKMTMQEKFADVL